MPAILGIRRNANRCPFNMEQEGGLPFFIDSSAVGLPISPRLSYPVWKPVVSQFYLVICILTMLIVYWMMLYVRPDHCFFVWGTGNHGSPYTFKWEDIKDTPFKERADEGVLWPAVVAPPTPLGNCLSIGPSVSPNSGLTRVANESLWLPVPTDSSTVPAIEDAHSRHCARASSTYICASIYIC